MTVLPNLNLDIYSAAPAPEARDHQQIRCQVSVQKTCCEIAVSHTCQRSYLHDVLSTPTRLTPIEMLTWREKHILCCSAVLQASLASHLLCTGGQRQLVFLLPSSTFWNYSLVPSCLGVPSPPFPFIPSFPIFFSLLWHITYHVGTA